MRTGPTSYKTGAAPKQSGPKSSGNVCLPRTLIFGGLMGGDPDSQAGPVPASLCSPWNYVSHTKSSLRNLWMRDAIIPGP